MVYRTEYNNKNEDNSLIILSDKNYQVSSGKFQQIIYLSYHYLIRSRNFKYHDINHIYPTPPLGQDMTQGQFLCKV